MTKYLSIISFFALIFTACEKSEEAANKSAIKLITESEINVGPGSAMGFIKYELITPVDGASVEATANVDWIGNFGYKEIADSLEMPLNTVKTKIRRAKAQLLKMMDLSDELL